MSWNEGLRPGQQDVAGSTTGHARLLAGPGTGKTYVLVRRAQFLLDAALAPRGLLALTFTRAAAAEMRTRLAQRLGERADRVRISTLHSHALSLLLRCKTTFLPQPLRIAGDWEERHVIVQELADALGRKVKDVKQALVDLANDWDTLAADGQNWIEGYRDPAFLGAWQAHRRVYGYTLRSELVYQLRNELRADPGLSPPDQPDVLLVDEYQDLNQCDLATIAELSRRCAAHVFAAGDDDQSIYSFRSAAPAGIRGFMHDYPGAKSLLLEEGMRCGPHITALANWLISQESGRVPKTLVSVADEPDEVTLVRFRDQHEEASGIAALIDAAISTGTAPEDVLVLFKSDRGGRVSKALADALLARGHLAYRPRRDDEEDPDLVRLQQYLQLAQALAAGDVDELALRCLVQLEDHGVGETTLGFVVEQAIQTGQRWTQVVQSLCDPGKPGPRHRRRLVEASTAILDRARDLMPRGGESVRGWVDRVAAEISINPTALLRVHLLLETDELDEGDELKPEGELPALSGVDKGPPRHVQQLLAALNGLSDALAASVPGQVTITTMHGAKGLTAKTVFVCHLEDEILPGDAAGPAEAEARRLLYVSLTRARQKLYLGYCGTRTGAQQYRRGSTAASTTRHLTRFLREAGLQAHSVTELLPLTS